MAEERSPRRGRGGRRVSPRVYKLLVVSHVVVAVGWLGIVAAKLVLGVAAVTAAAPAAATAGYLATETLDVAFPPVAILTVVTGVALSLGTRWGLVRHTWVVVKQVLTAGVIVTAVRFADGLVASALAAERAPGGPPVPAEPVAGALVRAVSDPATPLLALTAAHALMLVAATALSVYKPWGRIRRARPDAARTRDGGAAPDTPRLAGTRRRSAA